MEYYLLKGFLIGILFGMPAGAVGAMTVQRVLNHGPWAGMISGLGSSAADCFYAAAGAFGLTVLSDFMLQNQTVINCLGGGFLLLMGVRMITTKNKLKEESSPAVTLGNAAAAVTVKGAAGMFFSSFAVGITNPAAILSFVFAFSYFGLSDRMNRAEGTALVAGVFLGTMFWWGLLSAAVSLIGKKAGNRGLQNMNKVFGVILSAFSLILFAGVIF